MIILSLLTACHRRRAGGGGGGGIDQLLGTALVGLDKVMQRAVAARRGIAAD